MEPHEIVSRDEWIAARKAHLAEEKTFTRARDALSRKRRELPWEKVAKAYAFDGAGGKETLANLFGGKSQLIEMCIRDRCRQCLAVAFTASFAVV